MAIISSTSLLRTISIFHLTTAYYLLTSPLKLADQNLVFILGAAMTIVRPQPHLSPLTPPAKTLIQPEAPPSLSLPSPALALASLFLALLSISDLTATNLDEEVASYYWSSQAPVRLLFFFGVTGYSYLAKPEGVMASPVGKMAPGAGVGRQMPHLVCNSLVFTWGFVEMLGWFWVSALIIAF